MAAANLIYLFNLLNF